MPDTKSFRSSVALTRGPERRRYEPVIEGSEFQMKEGGGPGYAKIFLEQYVVQSHFLQSSDSRIPVSCSYHTSHHTKLSAQKMRSQRCGNVILLCS